MGKAIYPYEYINDGEKFNEASLPEKEDFYSHLNKEDITDADYVHAKRVYKDFGINNLGEYHGFIFKVMHYCQLMYLKALEICVLKCMNMILKNLSQHLN